MPIEVIKETTSCF